MATEADAQMDRLVRTIADPTRLETLDRYDILGTGREPAFDRIVDIIKRAFDVPIAIVSVIDGHRQWYKAVDGLRNDEAPIQETFCRYTMADGKAMIVCNAPDDARFADSPYVTADPGIRFYASAPLTSQEGLMIGTVCAIDSKAREFSVKDAALLDDIAALTMEVMEMRRVAQTDALTGALTRRGLVQSGRLAIKRSDRNRQELACIVFDIDHFKQINDRFGHAAGDQVLQEVSEVCRSVLREIDHFGRIGGEEFAVLLENTNGEGAYAVAEKLRQEIEALDVDANGKSVRVTASFGVSSRRFAKGSLSELLAAADANLYTAKRSGRNQTRQSADNPPDLRRRVLKAGLIRFDNGRTQMPCTVRSLSTRSAGLDLSDASDVPAYVTLSIVSDGFEAECRVVSVADRHIEVEFG